VAVLAANTIAIVRVVSTPNAIDTAITPANKIIMRTAPDAVMVLHASPDEVSVPDDEHAIIESEFGFSMIAVSRTEFDRFVRPLVEWRIPESGLAQGLCGFVPVKMWLKSDGVRILVATSFAETLLERMRAQ
jgi:hypothetical protein